MTKAKSFIRLNIHTPFLLLNSLTPFAGMYGPVSHTYTKCGSWFIFSTLWTTANLLCSTNMGSVEWNFECNFHTPSCLLNSKTSFVCMYVMLAQRKADQWSACCQHMNAKGAWSELQLNSHKWNETSPLIHTKKKIVHDVQMLHAYRISISLSLSQTHAIVLKARQLHIHAWQRSRPRIV